MDIRDVCLLYILIFFLLYALKPRFMIDEKTKKFKQSGHGITLTRINPILALLSFFIITRVDPK